MIGDFRGHFSFTLQAPSKLDAVCAQVAIQSAEWPGIGSACSIIAGTWGPRWEYFRFDAVVSRPFHSATAEFLSGRGFVIDVYQYGLALPLGCFAIPVHFANMARISITLFCCSCVGLWRGGLD